MRNSFFLVLLCALGSATAWAGPYGFHRYLLSTSLEGSFFTTRQNLDAGGTIINLPGDNQFNEQRYTLRGNYDWSEKWGTFASFAYRRNASLDPLQQRTNSGPSDITTGASYLAWTGAVQIIPELSVSAPLYKIDENADDVLLGNGALEVNPRLVFAKDLRGFSAMAYAGYKYRSRGLSGLLPYGIGARRETAGYFLELMLNGASSVAPDASAASAPARGGVISHVDAGSAIYSSVNPNSLSVGGQVAWKVEPSFYVAGGAEQIIGGSNIAYGTRFMVIIGLNEMIGGGHRVLGQEKKPPVGHTLEEPIEVRDRGKKFRVQQRKDEEIPSMETIDVEIKHVKPAKKKIKKKKP